MEHLTAEQEGEFGFIEALKASLPPVPEEDGFGIGDDAALVRNLPGGILLSTDLSVEGVHFRSDWSTDAEIVRKALVSNLSDINAMGGVPKWILLGLGIPKGFPGGRLAGLRDEMARACAEHGVALLGGDTVTAPALTFAITVAGRPGRRVLRRGAAAPGQAVWVSGPLGRSRVGLELLLRGRGAEGGEFARECLAVHRSPGWPAGLGEALARDERTGACVDVSDGLSSEANHLARESGVRIVLDLERLPAPDGLAELASGLGLDPAETVLSSGEEYQLLFTSSAPGSRIETIFKEKGLPAEPRRVGVVERGEGVFGRRADGALVPVAAKGWSHF